MDNKNKVPCGNHCDIWVDYQVCRCALEEAEELSHQNWLEIKYLLDRVYMLELYIKQAGLTVPKEH